MSFVKAEVIKCGTAPGDSNAIRLVVDVYEIYRGEFYGLGLDIKGTIVTIVRMTDETESTSPRAGLPSETPGDL